MDTDLIIGVIGIVALIVGIFISVRGIVTIFKRLKADGNTVGIIAMIAFTFILPMGALAVGGIYDLFIDNGKNKEEEEEVLNEESE